eukprot:2106648-Alexandrium_andersonii.AAC.1
MDASLLIAEAHGKAIRLIAAKTGKHFECASQVARLLWREHVLTTRSIARRLDQLATAYAICRHITS